MSPSIDRYSLYILSTKKPTKTNRRRRRFRPIRPGEKERGRLLRHLIPFEAISGREGREREREGGRSIGPEIEAAAAKGVNSVREEGESARGICDVRGNEINTGGR